MSAGRIAKAQLVAGQTGADIFCKSLAQFVRPFGIGYDGVPQQNDIRLSFLDAFQLFLQGAGSLEIMPYGIPDNNGEIFPGTLVFLALSVVLAFFGYSVYMSKIRL